LEVLVGRIELKVSEKEVGLRLMEVSGRPGPPVLVIEMPAVEVHVTGVSFGRCVGDTREEGGYMRWEKGGKKGRREEKRVQRSGRLTSTTL
jgi:hypothetical protein